MPPKADEIGGVRDKSAPTGVWIILFISIIGPVNMKRKFAYSSALVQNLDEMVEYLEKIDEIDREEIRLYVERNFSVKVMAEEYTRVYKN